MLSPQASDRRGHESSECCREGAEAQLPASLVGELGELRCRELEALGDGVCVREQYLAGGRELQPAGPAVKQLGADLALEKRYLLRDGGLRDPELARGAREGTLVRDGSECQNASGVHNLILSQ